MKIFFPSLRIWLALCMTQITVEAQTLRLVPQNYATIQSAIDAAHTGDTVLISPGVYFENLQLRGRDLVLTSRYLMEPNPAAVIRSTIIDGSQPSHPDTASCLLIWKGESNATVIQGLTFQGGRGTIWLDPAGAGVYREGGGILTEGSSPLIRHNIIRNNVVTPNSPGTVSEGGGGIRCGAGSVQIKNNLITHNRADGYGGGVVLNYCPGAVVENNIITFNYGGADFSGGGFWATGQNTSTVNTLRNNTIAYNTTPAGTGQYSGKAGGIWVFTITLAIENNIIWGNTQAIGKPIAQFGGAALLLKNNCVEGGFGGVGNISLDPMFRDTTSWVLEAGSPAIDAGADNIDFPDFSRNTRTAAFPARGNLKTDMGAYGGPNPVNPACSSAFLSPQTFTKVLNSPVVTTAGDSRSVNWVDIDNDLDLDLFISNGPQSGEDNFLYKNNGKGGFTAVTDQPLVQDHAPSDGASWADYDNDGDMDCFVVNWYGVDNLLYNNNGDGTFTKVTTGSPVTDGGFSETTSWSDYNKDGFLDLYVTNSSGNKRNFLYQNNGNGTFTKITTGAPVTDAATSRNISWTDYDLDGDPDLFVTNEGGEHENLYRNDNGMFTKITGGPLLTASGKTMSSSWADFDNDGDFDVYLANDQGNDALFTNQNGTFTRITTGPVVTSGGNTFSSQWADIDNDSDLDLFVTNSFWGSQWQNFLFLNQGNGTFIRDTAEIVGKDLGWSYGCAFGDFDRDGDLDLSVANCYNANQTDYLYENHSSETTNNWLSIQCTGVSSNRSAIGAKLWLHTTVNGQPLIQMREISAHSGHCGQNQLNVHFGLGEASFADSLVIQWPLGLVQRFGAIQANRFLQLTEGQFVGTTLPLPNRLPALRFAPNPFTDSIQITWEMYEESGVLLEIMDSQGTVVCRNKSKYQAGTQHWLWNGCGTQGERLPAGVYFVRMAAEQWEVTGQMIKQ
ncbi:MAG: VCBS repeat-containing protein [Saprospiraceae bacterium]|nr:VCBS repeat-containing protein [Saprospiraceae bacterium]